MPLGNSGDSRATETTGCVFNIERFATRDGTRIAVELDWNDQPNGSYLSAGLILAPEPTEANPSRGRSWLKVEYVGVPPGRNARLVVD